MDGTLLEGLRMFCFRYEKVMLWFRSRWCTAVALGIQHKHQIRFLQSTNHQEQISKISSNLAFRLMMTAPTISSEMNQPRRSRRLLAKKVTGNDDTKPSTIIPVDPPNRAESKSRKRNSSIANNTKDEITNKKSTTKISPLKPSKSKLQTKKSDEQITFTEDEGNKIELPCLPRTMEMSIRVNDSSYKHVIGIDEAGRGPLAGPVVCAAVIIPPTCDQQDIPGIIDSKKLTQESDRELLYEKIIASPNITWAVAVVNAAVIDEINILQATLLGMKLAASTIIGLHDPDVCCFDNANSSIDKKSYVVFGGSRNGKRIEWKNRKSIEHSSCYCLIDGNKIPQDMPCESQAVVKGDGKEYVIAVASILAKVTRDRLMHEYDTLYPQYNLKQHKGYPTAAHMAAVHKFGASPIHRRTFAPLKYMEFDAKGSVIKVKAA